MSKDVTNANGPQVCLALVELNKIAAQALQHGKTGEEGWGRVGMIGGRVFKFNTTRAKYRHDSRTEVGDGNFEQMRAACDNLRHSLLSISKGLYGENVDAPKKIKDILASLGIVKTGHGDLQVTDGKGSKTDYYAKYLPDRSLIARFVNAVRQDVQTGKGHTTQEKDIVARFKGVEASYADTVDFSDIVAVKGAKQSAKFGNAQALQWGVGNGFVWDEWQNAWDVQADATAFVSKRAEAEFSVFLQCMKAHSLPTDNRPHVNDFVYPQLVPSEAEDGRQKPLPGLLACYRAVLKPSEEFYGAVSNYLVKKPSKWKLPDNVMVAAQNVIANRFKSWRDNPKAVLKDEQDALMQELKKVGVSDEVCAEKKEEMGNNVSYVLNAEKHCRENVSSGLVQALDDVLNEKEDQKFSDDEKKDLGKAMAAWVNEAVEKVDETALIESFCTKVQELNMGRKLEMTEGLARRVLGRALAIYAGAVRSSGQSLLQVGGGFAAEMSYSFRARIGEEGRQDLSANPQTPLKPVTSSFVPAPPRAPFDEKGLRTNPIVNLGLSSLKQGEKTLVSFVRFGQVNAPAPDKDHDCVRRHYADIARMMLLNDPILLKQAKEGVVELPVYRVDMSSGGDPRLPIPDEPMELGFEIEGVGHVQVKAKVHCFHVPIDIGWTDEPSLDRTVKELETMLVTAKAELEKIRQTDQSRAGKIERLVESLKTASTWLKKPRDPLFFYPQEDPQLLRFGSQVAMLASLLGHTPAINCNWGRDRTGLMDSEIKMLACKLTRDDKISVDADGQNDVRERTEFLTMTGNNEMAFCMNGNDRPVNLNQGNKGVLQCFDQEKVVRGKYCVIG